MSAQYAITLTVDHNRPVRKNNFNSIQDAINSLSDSSSLPRLIVIKKGTYNEKLFILKHNIILSGEDRETTIITFDIARDEWRCDHADDWGVATINLNGNDITFINLTIANEYGYHNTVSRTVSCKSDTVHHEKIIGRSGHQMALRSMKSTRLKAINCRFKSFAGDTVSPWNLNDGMFYFKDCLMEGGVDFYCPRGWAYAENCSFFANSGDASIWHDGSHNPEYKTVFKNCYFDGYKDFKLGRYHLDAQFYLIDCTFSENMADKDIYQVKTTNILQFGRRVYYYNCHRTGGDYSWFQNNLQTSVENPTPSLINEHWVFKQKWAPQKNN